MRLALVCVLVLTTGTAAAPVPTHLMKSSPPEFYVGFLWNYRDNTYVVRGVDGEWIRYRCQSDWTKRHNCTELDYDTQTIRTTRAEMESCEQPRYQPHAPKPYSDNE